MTCDNCSGSLYQRSDDKEETIKKRLAVYQQDSAPLIKYYEAQGKLRRLDADEDINLVLEKIVRMACEHDSSKV